jgi:hypothetical protein
MTVWHMRSAWWITKATNTVSEYVILIASPMQPASLLRYTYTVCLVEIASTVRNHTATHSRLPTPTGRNAATKVCRSAAVRCNRPFQLC